MLSDNSPRSLLDLVQHLGADVDSGLSQDEAEKRLGMYGLNIIPRASRNLFQIYVAPLLNWLVNIYLIITTILALLAIFVLPDLWGQVAFWIVFIVLNAAVAIVQQIRAQKKLEALENMSPPRSKVIRDGQVKEIKSEELVPGDVIKLEQGDRVPADASIIKASFLMVNEAPLTGESVPQEKSVADQPSGSVSDKQSQVFLGTYVTAGTATALVISTGSRTRLGGIAETVTQLNTGDIPLRQKVNKVARYLASAVVIYLSISLAYHLILLARDGQLVVDGAFNARLAADTAARSLITSMSIMPINIPLLTTIILLAGTLSMAKQRVVIRDLSAVESLGRVSVVCTDKTGTITKNEMTVRWICLPDVSGKGQIFGASGVGFDPSGKLFATLGSKNLDALLKFDFSGDSEKSAGILAGSALETLLTSGMLNNESSIVIAPKENQVKREETPPVYCALGDTTDAALLVLFRKSGLDEDEYRSFFNEITSYPFDSKRLLYLNATFSSFSTIRIFSIVTPIIFKITIYKCIYYDI